MDVSLNDVVKALRCVTQPNEVCHSMEIRLGCKEGGCPYYQNEYFPCRRDGSFETLLETAADIISGAYGGINND